VLDVLEDANVKLGTTFGLTGDALKEARTALVEGPLPMVLSWLQAQLAAHGGAFFADSRLTIADLKVFVFVRGLVSGKLDHVPADLVEKVAPKVSAHMQRIAQIPAVVQYYAKFSAS
jgi:glutathione S-transferase